MKSATTLVFLALLLYSVVGADRYTDRYDNVDINTIIKNDRLLKNYANCLFDKGNCTPDAQELKGHLQEALDNGCENCTEKQIEGVKTVIFYVAKNKPEIWKEACEKFDPDGKYRKKYADILKQEGISID